MTANEQGIIISLDGDCDRTARPYQELIWEIPVSIVAYPEMAVMSLLNDASHLGEVGK